MFRFINKLTGILSFYLLLIVWAPAYGWCVSSLDSSLNPFFQASVTDWRTGQKYWGTLVADFGILSEIAVNASGYGNRSCHETGSSWTVVNFLTYGFTGQTTYNDNGRIETRVKAHGDIVCSGSCPGQQYNLCNAPLKSNVWWTLTCQAYDW